MAYVALNEEENQQGPTGQTTPNPIQTLPPQAGGSIGSTGGTSGGSPNQGSPTQVGSGASRLSDYLTANAPSITSEGNNIAGNVTQQFNQVGSDINAAGQAFQGQVAGSYTPNDPTLNAEAAANPQGVVGDSGKTTEFQNELNDTYTGPSSYETTTPYANIENETNTAVQNAALLESPGGLSSYLQTQYPETPGQNALDTALLESQPEASNAIQTAVAPFSTLTTNLSDMTSQSDAAIANAQAQAAAAQAGAQGALTGAAGNLSTALGQAVTGAQTPAEAENAAILADLALNPSGIYYNPSSNQTAQSQTSGSIALNLPNLSAADLTALGMTQEQYDQLNSDITNQEVLAAKNPNDVNPNPNFLQTYLQQTNPSVAITPQNEATADQYATAQALAQLEGLATTPQALNLPITGATAGQAGTAPTNFNQYNTSGLLTYLGNLLAAENYTPPTPATKPGATEFQKITSEIPGATPMSGGLQGSGTGTNAANMAIAAGEDVALFPLAVTKGVQTIVQDVSSGSWVCSAMRRAGVLTQEDVDRLHDHLYKAFWKRPFAFMRYWLIGRPVVWCAESLKIDWKRLRPFFYDIPMVEPDSAKAVDLYERAFWMMFKEVFKTYKSWVIQ